ncbi:hypothetical protein H4582DRAFT_2097105 [Lactarius indigo]|nr:hypothetical protein H4582DRAFT_2097105 [Lactarius indigo]
MLSRFSVLFVYLVAGLAVSAVATPMGQSGGYGDGTKQPSKNNSTQEHPNPPKYYSARDAKGQYKHPKDKEYDRTHAGQCKIGKQQCCNSMSKISDHEAGSSIFALFGGVLDQFEGTANIGHECSPSYNYAGTKACTGQTVCCENTDASGYFAIGCNNVDL